MGPSQTSGGARGAAEEQLRRLRPLLEADPENERLGRECSDAALACGDFEFVLQWTQQRLLRSPQDLQASFDRATALIGKRDHAGAIDLLQGIVRCHPDVIAAQINLGLCHYILLQFAQAREPLENAYRAGDRTAGLLRLLVSTYHHVGTLKEALAVAEANPQPGLGDAGLAGVYALCYLDAGKVQAAAQWAKRTLSMDADSVDGLTVQATLDTARADLAHAKQRYERVVQIDPHNGRTWIGLGTLAMLRRDLSQARSFLARGVEYMPGHVGSWNVLAWAHLLSGDLTSAEQALQVALKLDHNFAETHGGLASVAALRSDQAAAEREIEIALGLNSRCLSAQFARAVLMNRGGEDVSGREIIRKALSSLAPGEGILLACFIKAAAQRS